MNDDNMDPEDVATLLRRLAALSHPARVRILKQLARSECCCKDVVGGLDLAQSTVSQHLKILISAGLVRTTPDRQRSVYQIDGPAMIATAKSMAALADACCPPNIGASRAET